MFCAGLSNVSIAYLLIEHAVNQKYRNSLHWIEYNEYHRQNKALVAKHSTYPRNPQQR